MLKDSHNCVERAMHHNCPVCFEVNLGEWIALIMKWKSSISSFTDIFHFFCAVSVWYYKRHYRLTLWTHYTFGMCERNGTTFPVSFLRNKGSCWCMLITCIIFFVFFPPLKSMNFLQVFMPCLLKVLLWYVPCVGKTWSWGISIVGWF